MSTNIFLGMPPPKIKEWIEKNYVKPWPEKTSVIYTDGSTWEGLIEGELNSGSIPNISNIKELTIGNKVTRISEYVFCENYCTSLTSITIPNSVTHIGECAFQYCPISNIPTATTTQVEQWFNSGVFGYGDNSDSNGSAEYTISCKDGIIHCIGIVEWDEDLAGQYCCGIGWDITITPL